MKFYPENNYLLVKVIETPKSKILSVPIAGANYSFGVVVEGLKTKEDTFGVLFNNIGRSKVYIENAAHVFIKKDEIISKWFDNNLWEEHIKDL